MTYCAIAERRETKCRCRAFSLWISGGRQGRLKSDGGRRAFSAKVTGESMDNCRFDNLTRVIAERADRRTAVKRFAGGIAALAA